VLRRFAHAFVCFVAAILVESLTASASAAGGPPFVSDDPDTPGSGNWEINTAVIGAQSHHHWDLAAPDFDINYGWGEHVQLKLDLNWASAESADGRRMSGLGAADVGVKWRFVDQEKSGFALSIYPQLLMNLASSSAARGLTSEYRQFLLPAEVSTVYGGFEFDAEAGRNFVQGGPDAWVAGMIAAHACGPKLECGLELHGELIERQLELLVNLGVHWEMTKHVILLASFGRDISSSAVGGQPFLFYFGVQFLRES
jgi:hypothetical protein